MNSIVVNVVEALVGVVAVVGLSYREMIWTVVDLTRMWRVSLVFGVLGIGILFMGGSRRTFTPLDFWLLLTEVAVGVVTGALMGVAAQFRPMDEAALGRWQSRSFGVATRVPTTLTRTGWIGVGLWVALLAARVTLGLLGHSLGSVAAVSAGMILLVIGVNRAANALTLSLGHERHIRTVTDVE